MVADGRVMDYSNGMEGREEKGCKGEGGGRGGSCRRRRGQEEEEGMVEVVADGWEEGLMDKRGGGGLIHKDIENV